MMPVMQVPRLAPRMVAYMRSTSMTPMPASGVSTAVVIEDDCTSIVIPAPTAIAR